MPDDATLRHFQAVEIVKARFDDLTAQPPVEVDRTDVGVEYPEIDPALATARDLAHRGAQQTAAQARAPSIGMDVQVVDVGAEAGIALGPRSDEAQPVGDQHRVLRTQRRELAP